MFHVDITEQVRLSFETLEDACDAHAEAAHRLSRLSSWFRIGTLAATAISAVLAGLSFGNSASAVWHIASLSAAATAFAVCAAYVGFNQQPRIQGHRACSARLWLVCEKYRWLLAEMHEGRLDLNALRERRNALLEEAAGVFEQAAPADRYTFEIARRALGSRSGAPAVPPPSPVAT
jgi:SMODS and SLOG-associating 2TM effector domain family 4